MTHRDHVSADPAPATAGRRYPVRPVVGVGAVVLVPTPEVMDVGDIRVVLVKRRFEPLAGRWSVPGGVLELGETLADGLVREVREETGVEVEVGPVVDVFDGITLDAEGRVQYHYVLIDYVCRFIRGRLEAGSDVSAVELVAPADLARYDLTPRTSDVIRRAVAIVQTAGWR
jgi:8-oxo-dGTP diphosphatase